MPQNTCIKLFKQFFVFSDFQIKWQKWTLGKKAYGVVRKLGHKSTQVLAKIGSKAVDVASRKAANYLVGAAAAAAALL